MVATEYNMQSCQVYILKFSDSSKCEMWGDCAKDIAGKVAAPTDDFPFRFLETVFFFFWMLKSQTPIFNATSWFMGERFCPASQSPRGNGVCIERKEIGKQMGKAENWNKCSSQQYSRSLWLRNNSKPLWKSIHNASPDSKDNKENNSVNLKAGHFL